MKLGIDDKNDRYGVRDDEVEGEREGEIKYNDWVTGEWSQTSAELHEWKRLAPMCR
jgi:hypothetical protein